MQVLRHASTGAPEGVVVAPTELNDAAALRWMDASVVDAPLLLSTVDLITPVLDDPYAFGQVAAANALSDVYAMGGEPRFALAIAMFPSDVLPLETLEAILAGGADRAREAGAAIVGGHTIKDAEPKYGLAVTGAVMERDLITQAGARPGDVVVLTKALGTGLLVGSVRAQTIEPHELDGLRRSMIQLNRDASRVMRRVGVRAATDVTGFGLLGHARHVAQASGVCLELEAGALPALDGALARAGASALKGAAGRNHAYVADALSGIASPALVRLAVDPQTSGGLLLCVAPESHARLSDELAAANAGAWTIGRVVDGPAGTIRWA